MQSPNTTLSLNHAAKSNVIIEPRQAYTVI